MTKFRSRLEWREWRAKTIFFLLCLMIVPSQGQDNVADTQALLAFKAAVDPNEALFNWEGPATYCSWTGVDCTKGRVSKVRLAGRGLAGAIPEGTLGQLDQLRALNLHSNKLDGHLPDDLSTLQFVQNLYFHNNKLNGSLPSNFSVWPRLLTISLANNQFSGSIPASLTQLKLIKGIYLEGNQLNGSIPNITSASLKGFNVASNNLSGPIPLALQKFPASGFAGNLAVCGPPMNTTCPLPSPSPSPSSLLPAPIPVSTVWPPFHALAPVVSDMTPRGKHKKRKLGTGAIIAIVFGGLALAILLLLILCLCFYEREGRSTTNKPAKKGGVVGVGFKSEDSKDEYSASVQATDRSKLVFFDGKHYIFDLEDLLRASAEVLGKGSVGTAYKAVLEDGSVVIVKRLKDMTTSKDDFDTQMKFVGTLQHRNLVPLRAYYFSKDEKLLVYDYMSSGSLSALLHGTKGGSRKHLDWIVRVRIATGVARALAYLHNKRSVTHGNIKSSNVLLTRDLEGCVSDFGLIQLLSSSAPASKIIGYRAPEVIETRKVSPEGDVYSFGVLLLELLTGKLPTQANLTDEGIDLPRWVQSVVREEWTSEVFDVELMKRPNIEEEMVQMLHIAMQCVSQAPSQRPTMDEIVKSLNSLGQSSDSGNENNGDETSRSAYDTSVEQSKDELDTPSHSYTASFEQSEQPKPTHKPE